MERILSLATLALVALVLPACAKDTGKEAGHEPAESTKLADPATEPAAPASPSIARRIEIAVTEQGFEPDAVSVAHGAPVTLVFTRRTDKTCATEVILEVADGNKVEKPLPLDEPVEVTVTFPRAGKLRYACAMDMLEGVISVE